MTLSGSLLEFSPSHFCCCIWKADGGAWVLGGRCTQGLHAGQGARLGASAVLASLLSLRVSVFGVLVCIY